MFSPVTINNCSPMSTNIVVILLELTFLRGREREGKKEKGKGEGDPKGEGISHN